MEMPTSWVHGAGGSFFWPHVPGAGVGVTGVGAGVTGAGVGGEVGPGDGGGVGTGALVEDGAGVDDACAGLQYGAGQEPASPLAWHQFS
jgi:hypothetical protein